MWFSIQWNLRFDLRLSQEKPSIRIRWNNAWTWTLSTFLANNFSFIVDWQFSRAALVLNLNAVLSGGRNKKKRFIFLALFTFSERIFDCFFNGQTIMSNSLGLDLYKMALICCWNVCIMEFKTFFFAFMLAIVLLAIVIFMLHSARNEQEERIKHYWNKLAVGIDGDVAHTKYTIKSKHNFDVNGTHIHIIRCHCALG